MAKGGQGGHGMGSRLSQVNKKLTIMKEDSVRLLSHWETQLDHRLEKSWRVFSWCAGILVTLTGAVIAASRGLANIRITVADRISLAIIIIITTTYAVKWINENLHLEGIIRDKIDKILEEHFNVTDTRELRADKNARFGYIPVIGILGGIALAATVLSCFNF